MNINNPSTAFYLVCAMTGLLGLVIEGTAYLLGATKYKRLADFLAILGLACVLLALLLALIAPNE